MPNIPRSLRNKLTKIDNTKNNTWIAAKQRGARMSNKDKQILLDNGEEYAAHSHVLNDREFYQNFNRNLLK